MPWLELEFVEESLPSRVVWPRGHRERDGHRDGGGYHLGINESFVAITER